MKILVLSDSHRYKRVMEDVIHSLSGGVDIIIHLGDMVADITHLAAKDEKSVHTVAGNCDVSESIPSEKTIVIGNKKIFMTHGHRYGVKVNYDRIVYAALEREVDICLFGHTHFPAVFQEKNTLFMNPGSISYPRGIDIPSYGIITISKDGETEGSIVGKCANGLCRVII